MPNKKPNIIELNTAFKKAKITALEVNKHIDFDLEVKEVKPSNIEVLMKSLKNKDEKTVLKILTADPKLMDYRFSCLQEQFLLPSYIKKLAKDFRVKQEDITFNVFQYALFSGFKDVAGFCLTKMDKPSFLKSNKFMEGEYRKQNLSNCDLLLLSDNLDVFKNLKIESLEKFLNCSSDMVFRKLFDRATKISTELFDYGEDGYCYPQKIFHYLIEQNPASKFVLKDNNNYDDEFRFIANLRDDKLLKLIISQNKNMTYTIIKDTLYGYGNDYKGIGVSFKNETYKKNTILNLINIHLEIYKELPYLKEIADGNKNGKKQKNNYVDTPLLGIFFNNYNNNLEKYFLNIKELRNQAQDMYNKNPASINFNDILESDRVNLRFLQEIGVVWNTDVTKMAQVYLTEELKNLKKGDTTKSDLKPSVSKFVTFCLQQKEEILFEIHNGRSISGILQKMGFADLNAKVEKKVFAKKFKEMAQDGSEPNATLNVTKVKML